MTDLLEYLQQNPISSILDLEVEDIKIEYFILSFKSQIIYFEFDARMKPLFPIFLKIKHEIDFYKVKNL